MGTYRAGYDEFGRRAWQEINGQRTYYLYDGETIIGEMDSTGAVIAENVWGLAGPLMMRRRENVSSAWYERYYVLDGFGHTRLLLDNLGSITDD